MANRLAEDMFRPEPEVVVVTGREVAPLGTRLRFWWLDVREWVARKILRVELLSDHECEP